MKKGGPDRSYHYLPLFSHLHLHATSYTVLTTPPPQHQTHATHEPTYTRIFVRETKNTDTLSDGLSLGRSNSICSLKMNKLLVFTTVLVAVLASTSAIHSSVEDNILLPGTGKNSVKARMAATGSTDGDASAKEVMDELKPAHAYELTGTCEKALARGKYEFCYDGKHNTVKWG